MIKKLKQEDNQNQLVIFNSQECKENFGNIQKMISIFNNHLYKNFFTVKQTDQGFDFIIKKQEFRLFFYKKTGLSLSFSNKKRESRNIFLKKINQNKIVFSLISLHDLSVHVLSFFESPELYQKFLVRNFKEESCLSNKALIWEILGAFMTTTCFGYNNEDFIDVVWKNNIDMIDYITLIPQESGYLSFTKQSKPHYIPHKFRELPKIKHDLILGEKANQIFYKYFDQYNNFIEGGISKNI